MTISNSTMKALWAAAGGMCSFTDCTEKLFSVSLEKSTPYTLGEMAHIKGERFGSSRYDLAQDPIERNAFANLILLCPNHHTLVDKKENEGAFNTDRLKQIKAAHEKYISTALTVPGMNLPALANELSILTGANKAVWTKYGPSSELANKNPHDEAAYAIWTRERVSTIVPNNRKIASLLIDHRRLLGATDQQTIEEFLLHFRSYEEWVNSNDDYKPVVRYPIEFDELINRIADARKL